MSAFEFMFSLYSLLLGFSLVELLSGLARTLKARLHLLHEGQAVIRVGWLTPLLGIFVMLDLISFWMAAWTVRDALSVSTASLMGIMLFASAYYLAAHLVFPDDLSKIKDLDVHYFHVRRIVLGALFVLLIVQLVGYALSPALVDKLANPRTLILTGVLMLLMGAAFFAKTKALNTVVLIALILRYCLVYLF
jgi:hypothetical protein